MSDNKQQSLFGDEFLVESTVELSSKYSKKVSTPIYIPRDRNVSVYECCDAEKYKRLVNMIDRSNVSDEEKKFLRYAATRFIVFNYESIADYYASADKEAQQLMEKLALVIIDFDKAIENGFVHINDELRRLYEQENS